MEWRAMLDGVWEMAKDAICQKVFAYGLPRQLPLPNLAGVSCVVTGCTSGIGFHTARELAFAGAHVIMACRNTKSATQIAHEWRSVHTHTLSIEVMEIDLSSLASVRAFAQQLLKRDLPIDILINNAGIYRMGEPQNFTKDGNEQHMQVNHLGPALLALTLLPLLLKSSRRPRIINVNSVAHHCGVVDPYDLNIKSNKRKYTCISAYGGSKLAHLMFLSELSSKLPSHTQVDIIAVHPGIVSTNLVSFIESHYKDKSFWRFEAAQGARSILYCATSNDIEREKSKLSYFKYDCKRTTVCKRARDVRKSELVWNKSLEILGLHLHNGLPCLSTIQ